jgi:hypothetical protein
MNVYPTAFYVKPTTPSILAKGRLKLLSKITFLPLYKLSSGNLQYWKNKTTLANPSLVLLFQRKN